MGKMNSCLQVESLLFYRSLLRNGFFEFIFSLTGKNKKIFFPEKKTPGLPGLNYKIKVEYLGYLTKNLDYIHKK